MSCAAHSKKPDSDVQQRYDHADTDFSTGQGDKLDLTDTLDLYDDGVDSLLDFVKIEDDLAAASPLKQRTNQVAGDRNHEKGAQAGAERVREPPEVRPS